ncbi:MAG: DegT/DnrJ/EryC1/StrS family aminotransferase [Candidatus Omnitrophota bacterium]
MKIPLIDLKKQYRSIKEEVNEAVLQVLESGSFILGENAEALEEEFAYFCKVKYAVGVASGTDALELSLRALGIGQGDKVITTPFTFIATTEAIGQVGATPIFVDINPETYNIDPKKITEYLLGITNLQRQAIKAIIPVHLYGQPCDMDRLIKIAKDYNLRIVEDCAQAVGSEYKGEKVGSFGDTGCFSFFPSKNLGAYGDGGMIVTNDEKVAQRLRMLRVHGSKDKYHHISEGRNSRLDELQAAILRVKLRHLNNWNESRRKNAAAYNENLGKENLNGKVILPRELMGAKHTYHLYVVRVKDRDRLRNFLESNDVQTGVHYPLPLHLQEVNKNLGYNRGDFPTSELISDEIISLPMYPELDKVAISYISDLISNFLKERR